MKKTIITIAICFKVFLSFSFDNEKVHPDIIKKAYELLEKRYIQSGGNIGDLTEIKDAVNGGKISDGAFDEDKILTCNLIRCQEYDPIYGYDIQVMAHFWNADKGDDYEHYFSCGKVGTPRYHNAWQKATKYLEYLNITHYQSDKDKSYGYLGRLIHLYDDMAVPAHTHIDPHSGGVTTTFCNEWTDDKYETYYYDHRESLLADYTHFDDLNGDGGFLYNTPNLNQATLFKHLFYTMNQLSSFFPSNNIDGNNSLPYGTNDVIQKHFAVFGNPSDYNSDNPEIIAQKLTTYMINSTANILYWYGLMTGQLRPITALNLSNNFSNCNQDLLMPSKITLSPGFKFIAAEANKTFVARVGNYPSSTLKSAPEYKSEYKDSSEYNDSVTIKTTCIPYSNEIKTTNVSDEFKTTRISENVKIYPNPANDYLDIELVEYPSRISIFDYTNRLVYKEDFFVKNNRIHLIDFKRGVYSIKIEQKNNVHIEKIIKQ